MSQNRAIQNGAGQNSPVIIGIDTGYGNVKTRNFCFKTGVSVHEKEPTFKGNLLIYGPIWYTKKCYEKGTH